MPYRSEYMADGIRPGERSRDARSSFDISDFEPFERQPNVLHGGLFGTGVTDDDLAHMAAMRGQNRDYSKERTAPLNMYQHPQWLDSTDSDGLAGLRGTFARDTRSSIDAPIYPFHTPSPYSSGHPELTPPPATFSSALPSMNNVFSVQSKNLTLPNQSASMSYAQNAHALVSPTPRPLHPGAMTPVMPPSQFAHSANLRGEPFYDPSYLPMDPSAPASYTAAFENYMQARNHAMPLPQGLQQEGFHHSSQRSPAASPHEVRTFFTDTLAFSLTGNARRISTQPINFLQMLQPTANPPYDEFVNRIVTYSDQQASVFLQV